MQNVPLSSQDITQTEIDAVLSVLKGDRLSIGPRTEAFENACAAAGGRKYGIAVNSGTSGLHLCVKSLGLGEGDEVITTPFSFVATTNCLLFERAKPVFVDIDPESYNMDPAAMEAAITPRTKAILPVEVFGSTAHFDEYERIAKKHGLRFIEDCCEALGGVLGDRKAGSFGDCGVFAFYPNKQITTGEGGMIVTDSEEIRDLCRSYRNQGRATQAWLSHARLGYNYRISEITATLGEVQVNRLDEILAKRRRAADMYTTELAPLIGKIHLPPMVKMHLPSWFVYVIRLDDSYPVDARDKVIEFLKQRGIGCNNYFVPIHHQPYIKEMFGTKEGDFPITERIAARTIALPFFANLSHEQVCIVRDVLKEALASV